MTNFLSLVTDSNFFPSLSGGADSSAAIGDAFANLLGATPLDTSLLSGTGLSTKVVTGTPQSQPLFAATLQAQPAPAECSNCVKLPATDKLVSAEAPDVDKTNAMLASPNANDSSDANPGPTLWQDAPVVEITIVGQGAMTAEGDMPLAAIDTVQPAEDAAELPAEATPALQQESKPAAIEVAPKEPVTIEPAVELASDDTRLPDELGELNPPAKDGPEELRERLATPDDKPTAVPGQAVSATVVQPAALPVEAAKFHAPQAENDEDAAQGDDPVPPATAHKSKEPSGAKFERLVVPHNTAASPQPANDVAPTPEFARQLASDTGDGAMQTVVNPTGAADHGGAKPLDAARMLPHAPASEAMVSARPGQIGRELAVHIAKHSKDGRDSLTIRLDPAELGRIHVRMHFDDHGSLRAHVTAESHAALDMLRRDSSDLARALGDAGVRTDGQSFRFDGRGQDGNHHGQRHNQEAPRQSDTLAHADEPLPKEPAYRRLRPTGGVDLFA